MVGALSQDPPPRPCRPQKSALYTFSALACEETLPTARRSSKDWALLALVAVASVVMPDDVCCVAGCACVAAVAPAELGRGAMATRLAAVLVVAAGVESTPAEGAACAREALEAMRRAAVAHMMTYGSCRAS